jgi:hypothetical protein
LLGEQLTCFELRKDPFLASASVYNPLDLPEGFQPGDVISYTAMCSAIGVNLLRGMNFRLRGNDSIILMSVRPGAPYADRVEDEGKPQ